MEAGNEKRIVVDRYTRVLLTLIAGLLTVIAIELAYHAPSATPRAAAQIPDTALQRKYLVDEARQTNKYLSAILEHLRTKPVKVELPTTDTKKNRAGVSARTPVGRG